MVSVPLETFVKALTLLDIAKTALVSDNEGFRIYTSNRIGDFQAETPEGELGEFSV